MNKKEILSESESREMLLWLAVRAAVEEADGRHGNSRRLKGKIAIHLVSATERTHEFIGNYGALMHTCPRAHESLHASASGVHQLEEWLCASYLSAYQSRKEYRDYLERY